MNNKQVAPKRGLFCFEGNISQATSNFGGAEIRHEMGNCYWFPLSSLWLDLHVRLPWVFRIL
jgi:hypothetical protein